MTMEPSLLFALLALFAVVVYVLADGFDLGVGILFLLAPRNEDRDIMMAGLEPVWDGNETWLVLGGTLLWAAFPAAYYMLLPAFYLPIMLMLLALVARGIAFAFRFQAARYRRVWDFVFAGGSVLATFMQGLILGGYLGGVHIRDGMFAGDPFDAFTILGALCGFGLIGGYALLGAGWLIWKTDGGTQIFAREVGRAALLLAMAMMLVVSAWTAVSEPSVAARWFGWPNIALLAPVPIVTGLVGFALWRSLWSKHETRVFCLGLVLFLLGFSGLIVSAWPFLVLREVTIWNGIADVQTLRFIAVGLVIVVPVVLAYQGHAYWVFRGKTRAPAHEGGSGGSPSRRTVEPVSGLHVR
jgi:cytochrome d ubiquinol oxidase subunit II